MKDEVAAAVVFLSQLVRKNASLNKDLVEKFQNNLSACLLERFKNHWYNTVPSKGQGYRCIRINDTEPIDPVLENAATTSGFNYHDLALPNELTLWVDPSEVTCRLGENHGFYTVVAQFRNGSSENLARTPDIDKILANHVEKKEVEQAKFRIATTMRSNRKDPNSRRSSPPVYPYDPAPQNYYDQPNGWEPQGPVYHGNDSYYGPNGWNNWSAQGNKSSLSPNGNSKSKNRHQRNQGHHANQGHHTTFSNHPSDKLHWDKNGIVAKA